MPVTSPRIGPGPDFLIPAGRATVTVIATKILVARPTCQPGHQQTFPTTTRVVVLSMISTILHCYLDYLALRTYLGCT
jgi:hypothetical protein